MDEKRALDPFPIFTRHGTPDDLNRQDNDIATIADHMEKTAARNEVLPRPPQGLTDEDIRFIAYSLIVHRTRRKKVLTEAHLRLLCSAMGIKREAMGAVHYFGLLPVKRQNVEKFYMAADAIAANGALSDNALAKLIGVSNPTIRVWKTLPLFKSRVDYVRSLVQGNHNIDQRWTVAISKVNRSS